VRNLARKTIADIALRDAINDGDFIGPRIVASGPALGITAATAMKTCCRPRSTFREREWRTASRECSTKFAKSSNTART